MCACVCVCEYVFFSRAFYILLIYLYYTFPPINRACFRKDGSQRVSKDTRHVFSAIPPPLPSPPSPSILLLSIISFPFPLLCTYSSMIIIFCQPPLTHCRPMSREKCLYNTVVMLVILNLGGFGAVS